jgi:hypothetical protein
MLHVFGFEIGEGILYAVMVFLDVSQSESMYNGFAVL